MPKQKLQFHTLLWSKIPDESERYAIIRSDTDSGIQVPKSTYELILDAYHGTRISLPKSTIRLITNAGFLVDSKEGDFETIKPQFSNIPNRFFTFILSPYLFFPLFFFILSSLVLLFDPRFKLPSFSDYFWSTDLFWVLVSAELTIYTLGFIHEISHFVVTRAVGGQAKLNFLSNRLFDLVFETESYHLAILPKHKRFLVYVSGSIVDMVWIAITLWYFYLTSINVFPYDTTYKVMAMVFIIQITSLAWQLNVYLQTDNYNYLSEKLGIYNLYQDTQKLLRSYAEKYRGVGHYYLLDLFNRIFSTSSMKEADDLRLLTNEEKRKLIFYTLSVVTGYILSVGIFISYTIPKDIVFIGSALHTLASFEYGSVRFVDVMKNAVILFLVGYSYFVLLWFALRKGFRK